LAYALQNVVNNKPNRAKIAQESDWRMWLFNNCGICAAK